MVPRAPLQIDLRVVDAPGVRPDQATDALRAVLAPGSSFEQAARAVLRYLQEQVPLGFWSVTRVENGRQTYLVLDENAYGLKAGGPLPRGDEDRRSARG